MLVLTIYTLTFSLGLPANVFTLVTLLGKARRGRVSPSDIFLLNLTSADLLLLLFLPFKMAEAAAGMTWPLPPALCPLANFCFYSSIYLSSLFLAALSVERYLGVVFPLRYKARRRPARVMAASAAIWLLACSHCSIVFVAQYHGGGDKEGGNSSLGGGPEGPALSGGWAGVGKMAEGVGVEPNASAGAVRISKRSGVGHRLLSVADPGEAAAAALRVSTRRVPALSSPGDPPTTTMGISKLNVVDPNGFGVANPGDPTATTTRISKRHVLDHEFLKLPNHGDSTTTTTRISKRHVPDPQDFKLPNHGDSTATPSAPRPASARRGSTISRPDNPKTSKPQISTPNRADTRDLPAPRPSSAATSPPPPSSTPRTYRCYDDFSKAQLSFVLPLRLELFLVLFLLPFAVTIFCYVNFVRVLLARPNIPLEKKQRAVGLAVATMVNFGVCFAPYNASHVVGFVQKQSPSWRVYALLLTSLNAALDPVIFYFSSTAVQRAMASVALAVRDKMAAAAGWCRGACWGG